LNNENAGGSNVGGGNSGGVGAEGATGSVSATEIEVAKPAAMATPDNGPDKVVPDAIPTDGTNLHTAVGNTPSEGPAKVLPHADLPATSNPVSDSGGADNSAPVATNNLQATGNAALGVNKAEGEGDLQKSVSEIIVSKLEEFTNRLENIENSGGIKKSADVDEAELKKSQEQSIWGGAFYAGEL
jgi:hypothetical protein